MYQEEKNQIAVHKAAAGMVRRNEANKKLAFAAGNKIRPVLKQLGTALTGLGNKAVISYRIVFGRNKVMHKRKKPLVVGLAGTFVSPLTTVLFYLTVISILIGIVVPILQHVPEDVAPLAIIIVFTMVFIPGTFRFVQEPRSGNAAERPLATATTACAVTRKDNGKQEIPLGGLIVGDTIHLSVGDMIPADVRMLEVRDLFASRSALTGESDPIKKILAICEKEYGSIIDYLNIAFIGSNVISGSATVVAVVVGDGILFGSIAVSIAGETMETNFTRGVNTVSRVLIRFMLVMVPVVFLINGPTKGGWLEAFLFATSVIVGLTPEMLPMIVTTCFAKGVISTSKKKATVKSSGFIQSFGATDVLCMDKTGTLAQDKVVLEYHIDMTGEGDTRVLRHACLNSYFRTGYKNLMNIAIIERTEEGETVNHQLTDLPAVHHEADGIPFDFTRRRLSTVAEDTSGKRQTTTGGAIEEMLSICSYAEYQREVQPLTDQIRQAILRTVTDSNEGKMRVVVIAQKQVLPTTDTYSAKDECGIVLMGHLAFPDPPKESTAEVVWALRAHGVITRILTGNNDRVTRCICKQVNLKMSNLLLGSDVGRMSDDELIQVAESTGVFARLSLDQKARVVTALRSDGHTVGFMGDGINDTAAMKPTDIGISVNTAVDIVKESADIILLEKNLMVLEQGIIKGHKAHANMIRYIRITASSNFGNMFSVLAASAFLPLLPMESVYLILLNLIYDLSYTVIPRDNVGEEFIAVPRRREASSIGSFMIWIGPTSPTPDQMTYTSLYFIFYPIFISSGVLYSDLSAYYRGAELARIQTIYAAMFHAGWFVGSMWSQTLMIYMIRTPKLPFTQSCVSAPVTLLTFTGTAVSTVIPFTALGKIFGFVAPPAAYFTYLVPCILLYMVLTTSIKKAYVRHFGELL